MSRAVTLTVGANNLFNTFPNHGNATVQALRNNATPPDVASVRNHYPNFSPFGINGGDYYAKVHYAF